MPNVVVRYQAKPDRADENQQLIEAVMAELAQLKPAGFTYTVYRLEDNVFVHALVEHESVANPGSLGEVPAFQAFTANIADRVEAPPLAMAATVVGSYG